MRRLLPRSLAGQMALLLGLALLAAQLVNFALILNERQKLSLARNQGPVLTRFASVAADLAQAAPEFRTAVLADASHRGARFALQTDSGITEAERDTAIETRLADALADAAVRASEIRAAAGGAAWQGRGAPPRDMQVIRLAIRQANGQWLAARMLAPRPDPLLAGRLALATLLLYLIVLGPTLWIAARLARPLRNLTRAAERFGGRAAPEPVTPSGPADLRAAIEAFNAMNARVIALLDDKDRMLGAIGHDLRTPLASLRIRVEGMEPDEEREAAVAKIEEMTAMLEDILVLARTGRAREEARAVDLAALAEAVTEEYADLGAPVRFAPSARQVAAVQPNLMRRALRNLIDNAVKYGGDAEVAVVSAGGTIDLRVADTGPGIPPEEMAQVVEPFYRREASRNRETGGSGLGLAIARSVAESHGGVLHLEPNRPSGLVAILSLPIPPSP